jgi:TonB family protein
MPATIFAIGVVLTLVSDTPPAMPSASQLAALRTEQDVRALAFTEDGRLAPTDLVLPAVKNRRQILSYVRAQYPVLKDNHTQPQPTIAWLFIDGSGHARSIALTQSTGLPMFDSLALKMFTVAEFDPATVGGRAVGLWLPFPAIIPSLADVEIALAEVDGEHGKKPMPLPFTDPPKLVNRNSVEQAINTFSTGADRTAPARIQRLLRPARLGGTVTLHIYIDANGTVQNAVVKGAGMSSEMNNIALHIAYLMIFSPAKLNGKPTDVWIEIPVSFRPQ